MLPRNARYKQRELVRDQDSAAGAVVSRPPVDPVWLMLDEVGEYLTKAQCGSLNADRSSCILPQGLRIGFMQGGENRGLS
jgi:hypothetical protein